MGGATYARNPLMADFEECYFQTKDGVKLRYLHKGEGIPFILVHGYGDDADCWLLNAPVFAEHYSVYCIELRGHAFSKATHGAHISRLGADLHEFIESIGAPKVNLLGWSTGCSVIWSYMELFGQDKINRAVFDDEAPMLVSNPAFTPEEILLTGSNPMDFWALVNATAQYGLDWSGNNSPFLTAFLQCFRRGRMFLSDEEYAALPDDYAAKITLRPQTPEMDAEQRRFMAGLLKDQLLLDWRDMLPTIAVPTLYITGDISFATTIKQGEWVANTIPNCKWVRIPAEDYGIHDLNLVAYKKFNRIVLEFLEQ